ncbi:MAG TPA: hypothetical protein O0X63_05865, partial [Methanocorpusculum sp.]|nr:hypothetical protein [Methanocorpusculum sp.]
PSSSNFSTVPPQPSSISSVCGARRRYFMIVNIGNKHNKSYGGTCWDCQGLPVKKTTPANHAEIITTHNIHKGKYINKVSTD